jgi:hypothetical protein
VIQVEAREGDINAGTYSGREAAGEIFGQWFRAFKGGDRGRADDFLLRVPLRDGMIVRM